MLRRGDSIEKAIITRQLAMKDHMNSKSWITQVHLLLHKYNLPTAHSLLNRTPKKHRWKNVVKSAVEGHWCKMLKQEASVKPSLKCLDLESCRINHGHPVWECGTNPSHTKMATIQALLLTQRYPLPAYSHSGKKQKVPSGHCVMKLQQPQSTSR